MIKVLKAGILDTIQDLGRIGYQKYGVVTSGAMDTWSHRIANLLVNNDENEATLEMTLVGPEILFQEDSLIALCGGEFHPTVSGYPIPMWRPVFIRKNSTLTLGHVQNGARAYLAIAGGIDLPLIMKSQSTYTRAAIGGFKGRALRKDDVLSFGVKSTIIQNLLKKILKDKTDKPFLTIKWSVTPNFISKFTDKPKIRVTRGRQYNLFEPLYVDAFFKESFTVSPNSDRMGYRLNNTLPPPMIQEELISEAVSFGSIQVPPDGKPIVLTADRQTTGGYPKIAQISTCDFSLIGQAKPGDKLFFTEISLDQSQKLYIEKEKSLQQLKMSIALKFARECK